MVLRDNCNRLRYLFFGKILSFLIVTFVFVSNNLFKGYY